MKKNPFITDNGKLYYNINEIDPQSTMFYNSFKECLVIPLEFDIEESPIGKVTLNGKPLKFELAKSSYYDHTRDMTFDNAQTRKLKRKRRRKPSNLSSYRLRYGRYSKFPKSSYLSLPYQGRECRY